MLEYGFKDLESLITTEIDSMVNSKDDFHEQFARVKSALSEQIARARRSFVLTLVATEQEDKRRSFVQYHQQSLINFSDDLFQRPESDDAPMRKFINHTCAQLDQVLDFLFMRFGEYFNSGLRPTEFSIAEASKQFVDFLDRLKVNRSIIKINPTLASIAIMPIEDFLKNGSHRTSYRTIRFLNELQARLDNTLTTEEPSDEDIFQIMLMINYNNAAFMEYYIDRLRLQLADTESISDQLEKLAQAIKWINQVLTIDEIAYDSTGRTLKHLLSDWLLEETHYLERKSQFTSKGSLADEAFVKKEFKLEFDMSVSQFACFIKSFVETGIIQNKNISELIRFLAKFVKTKRSENISYESFRMKYYNVEGGTKDAVRNVFNTAIGRINST
jgi:hypothetical protein